MFCFDAHSIEVNNLAKESLKTYENKRIIMGIRPENIYMEEIVAQTYPKICHRLSVGCKGTAGK